MCCYITYILPKSADEVVLSEAFEHLHIRLRRYRSELAASFLNSNEDAWMRHNDCDCSTSIGEALAEPFIDSGLAEAEKRYRRKGWNENKIQRALADMQHSSSIDRGPEMSLADVVARCMAHPTIPYIRLFYHNYSGRVQEELFPLISGSTMSCHKLEDALANLPEDTLLTIRR